MSDFNVQEFRSSSKRELEENISQLYETVNKLGSKEVNMMMVVMVTMTMTTTMTMIKIIIMMDRRWAPPCKSPKSSNIRSKNLRKKSGGANYHD